MFQVLDDSKIGPSVKLLLGFASTAIPGFKFPRDQ
jgi:hypothetical protein